MGNNNNKLCFQSDNQKSQEIGRSCTGLQLLDMIEEFDSIWYYKVVRIYAYETMATPKQKKANPDCRHCFLHIKLEDGTWIYTDLTMKSSSSQKIQIKFQEIQQFQYLMCLGPGHGDLLDTTYFGQVIEYAMSYPQIFSKKYEKWTNNSYNYCYDICKKFNFENPQIILNQLEAQKTSINEGQQTRGSMRDLIQPNQELKIFKKQDMAMRNSQQLSTNNEMVSQRKQQQQQDKYSCYTTSLISQSDFQGHQYKANPQNISQDISGIRKLSYESAESSTTIINQIKDSNLFQQHNQQQQQKSNYFLKSNEISNNNRLTQESLPCFNPQEFEDEEEKKNTSFSLNQQKKQNLSKISEEEQNKSSVACTPNTQSLSSLVKQKSQKSCNNQEEEKVNISNLQKQQSIESNKKIQQCQNSEFQDTTVSQLSVDRF